MGKEYFSKHNKVYHYTDSSTICKILDSGKIIKSKGGRYGKHVYGTSLKISKASVITLKKNNGLT